MTTFSPSECKRLLELRKKATAGPWVESRGGKKLFLRESNNASATAIATIHARIDQNDNAAFIAAAHQLADQLEAAMGSAPTTGATEREALAAWMIERNFATGHGDTFEDLLKELSWQVKELRTAPAPSGESEGLNRD